MIIITNTRALIFQLFIIKPVRLLPWIFRLLRWLRKLWSFGYFVEGARWGFIYLRDFLVCLRSWNLLNKTRRWLNKRWVFFVNLNAFRVLWFFLILWFLKYHSYFTAITILLKLQVTYLHFVVWTFHITCLTELFVYIKSRCLILLNIFVFINDLC